MSLVGGYHSQSYHHHPHHTAHHSGGPTTTNGGLSPDYMTTGYGASAHTRSPYACNDPLSTAGGVVSPHDPPALPGAGVGCAGSSPSAMPGAPASSGAAGYFHHHASAVAPSWMLSPVAAAHEAAHAGGGAGGSSGVDAYGFPAPAGLNAPDYTGHAAAAMFGMAVDHAGTVYVARTGHRAVKRRGAANRKERRRTLSINTAFSNLRGCIPNVPTDTKLSKIKTLRLATSYIGYLMDVLNEDDPALAEAGFKAELTKKVDREERRRREAEELAAARAAEKLKREASTSPSSAGGGAGGDKKHRGRTGWPQHVWAAELGNVTAEATAGGGGAGSGSGGSNTLNTPQHEHPHHIPQNTGV